MLNDMPEGLVSINVAFIEQASGVNRQTIHNWIRADDDDPDTWLSRYDGETARRLKIFFSQLLDRDVEIIERIELDRDPSIQEAMALGVLAA